MGAPLNNKTKIDQPIKRAATDQILRGSLPTNSLLLNRRSAASVIADETRINILGREIGSKLVQGFMARVVIGAEKSSI